LAAKGFDKYFFRRERFSCGHGDAYQCKRVIEASIIAEASWTIQSPLIRSLCDRNRVACIPQLALASWVMRLHNLLKPLSCHMRIDGRRRNVGVA
jgi:hypothetical protein